MNAPTKLQESGEWFDLPSSMVTISSVTGGTCTYGEGIWNGKNEAIIRIQVAPSSQSAVSELAGISVGQVDAVITINQKTPKKAMGNGSGVKGFAISAYAASASAVRTRVYGAFGTALSSTVHIWF